MHTTSILHLTVKPTPQTAVLPTTSTTDITSTSEAQHAPETEAAATTTIVVEEVVEPAKETGADSDESSPVTTDDVLEAPRGWTFANYVFVLGFAAAFGALPWFLGGNRLVKRLAAGRGRGAYKRVDEDDVEKQS